MDGLIGFILVNLPGAVALVVAFMLGTAVEQYRAKVRRAEWRLKNGPRYHKGGLRAAPNGGPKTGVDFSAEQLKTVSRAKFTSRSLLNKAEANVFTALDKAVIARNPGWQVMAQVSLGEFLASPDKDAYFAVNSKRVDFALMDEKCRVVHALEYQGSGHHMGDCATARDAVKKEALRKAGIGYHEVVAGHTTAGELRALVGRLVPGG